MIYFFHFKFHFRVTLCGTTIGFYKLVINKNCTSLYSTLAIFLFTSWQIQFFSQVEYVPFGFTGHILFYSNMIKYSPSLFLSMMMSNTSTWSIWSILMCTGIFDHRCSSIILSFSINSKSSIFTVMLSLIKFVILVVVYSDLKLFYRWFWLISKIIYRLDF